MEKMTEEEKKMMDELVEEIKKEKKMKQTAPEKDAKQLEKEYYEKNPEKQTAPEKDAKQLEKEYYEKNPEKKPYLKRKHDEIKAIRAERKKDRAEEKRIYKEEYKKHKMEAIKKRAKRKAGERFKYTTREKVTGSVKRPPAMQKKRKTPKLQRSQRQYQPQRPRGISFDDALGSFGQPQQRKTTYKPVNFNTQVDYGSALGGFGSKKKKPIDPFEKLF